MTTETFHERMVSNPQLARLADLAASTPAGFPSCEVGCWEGLSSIAIARAVAPDRLVCVDTWRGWSGDDTARLASERDVFTQFMLNVAASELVSVIVPVVGDWRDYALGVEYRFVHLDGPHDTKSVRDQIRQFWPRVVPGGVLCGDDYPTPSVAEAVAAELPDASVGPERLWWLRKGEA